MGTPTGSLSFTFDAVEAQLFAERYDPRPVHLGRPPDATLPPGTMSGMFIAAEVQRYLLMALGIPNAELVLGTSFTMNWIRPIVGGENVRLEWRAIRTWNGKPGMFKVRVEFEVKRLPPFWSHAGPELVGSGVLRQRWRPVSDDPGTRARPE